jgi:hypothetical protein
MATRNAALFQRVSTGLVAMLCFAAPAVRAQWLNYRIPGVPRTPDGQVNLTAPTPRAPDGKPDLSGTWETEYGYFTNLAKDLKPDEVVMRPWAKAKQAERTANDNLPNLCMPPGVPHIDMSARMEMPHPFKVVQTPSLVVLLYETSENSTFRQVFLDGRLLPQDPEPTWLGYSVGRWDGDTLVVETTGFNGRSLIDVGPGHPQSENGRVIERFTRRDFGHLEIGITIDDPKAYVKPWTVKVPAHLLPDSDLIETYCENERDYSHVK